MHRRFFSLPKYLQATGTCSDESGKEERTRNKRRQEKDVRRKNSEKENKGKKSKKE